jgi:hypothetical protein
MRGQYVCTETFNDFVENQKELIKVLNHSMTKFSKSMIEISTDVKWIKKTIWWLLGILSGIIIIIVANKF